MHSESRVLVLQHAHQEHLGSFGDVFRDRSVSRDTVRPDLGEPVPSTLASYSGLVILGGPQSVCDENRFPFLRAEKALARYATARGIPVFGVCLGSQILAEALGARAYAGQEFEIGWKRVTLSPKIKADGVLGHLPSTIVPLHWHRDMFDLPPGAVPVGASEMTPVQGFAHSGCFYGLLFHLEVTLDQLQKMAAAFPDDLCSGGLSKNPLLSESPARIEALSGDAAEVFHRWLDLL